MTVYVDQFPDEGGGRWNGGAHMLTTDIGELHEMARRIGLKRAWFQDKTFPHYDLTRSKRQSAIESGAMPIEFGTIPDDALHRIRTPFGFAYVPRGERA